MTSPIPVYIGDDWGLLFVYADKTGAAISLNGPLLEGQLFSAYSYTPVAMTESNSRVVVVDAAKGKFALLVANSITAALQPDTGWSSSSIQVTAIDGAGKRHTIGVVPLSVLSDRLPFSGSFVTPIITDLATGSTLTFAGYFASPAPLSGPYFTLNFALPGRFFPVIP